MGKKNKNAEGRNSDYSKKTLRKLILHVFGEDSSKTLNYKQIAKKLSITDTLTKALIIDVLYDLIASGKIEEEHTGKFRIKHISRYFSGIIDLSNKNRGIVINQETGEEVIINYNELNHALHGDEVKVCLFAKRKKKHLEGEVTEIIKRSRDSYVGIIQISKSFAFLIPDNKTMPYDIFIPLSKLKGAKDGQKAIAKIKEWPERGKNPVGEVIDVLGNAGEHHTEMHAILSEFELPYRFPESLDEESKKISEVITKEEIKNRRDFRDITTFTIDPIDAKDFDDALSLKKLPNGNWEVGVHIADVAHFVEEESLIDQEAIERGTSVYLVDRVVPMLPERLSNFICSLRPNEDKLTFSAVFELDEQANIVDEWFGKTIINSNRRFNYEEAQQIIETGEGDFAQELLTLDILAKIIRGKRLKNGAFDFNSVEIKFNIDENGKPLSVYFKESKDSNKLIEEFMLLANRKVAELIGKPKGGKEAKTFVYRIHDLPDSEKLRTFSSFIKRFGYSIKTSNAQETSSSINRLLSMLNGKKEQNVIEQLAIRAMAKAAYSTDNIGHYGLAFDYYTHFTSPIRRYPDVMVHRLLFSYLNNGRSVNKKAIEGKCKHSSEMERKAAMAERASVKYKQVEFMQNKLGEVFEGVISGVTEWGIYVELVDNKIEGMVMVKDMEDDFYIFDEKNFCITGKYHRKKYQLGDNVDVQIIRTNLQKKQLDFMLYEE